MARTRAMLFDAYDEEERPMIMKKRTLPALGALALVCGVMYSVMRSGPPQALATTVEALVSATSMICVVTISDGTTKEIHQSVRWVAPDMLRMDYRLAGVDQTRWIEGTTITTYNHTTQRALTIKNLPGLEDNNADAIEKFATPRGLLDAIGSVEWEESDRKSVEEGAKISTYQFVSDELGSAELGVDNKTALPIEMNISEMIQEGGVTRTISLAFRWNVAIPLEDMEPVIPDGVLWEEFDGAVAAFPFTVYPGKGIGPIRLGMSRQEVLDVWGKPDSSVASALLYYSHGVDVVISKESGVWQVGGIVPTPAQMMDFPMKRFTGSTSHGLGAGSTEQEITKKLGMPEQQTENESAGVRTVGYPSLGIEFELRENDSDDGIYRVSIVRIRAPKNAAKGL